MPTLDAFVAEHFRDPIPAANGRSVAARCPVCNTDASVTARFRDDDYLSLLCTAMPNGEPCPNTIADALGMTEDRYAALLDAVEGPGTGTGTGTDDDAGKGKRLTADDVVEWVLSRYRVGRSTDGLLFAVPTFPGVPRVAREVRSIRADVVRRYRDEMKADKGRGVVIGRETLTSALDAVSAYAEAEDPVPVFLRAAQIGDDRIVLDLGDNAGRVVEVSPRGWEVVEADENTPLFRRSEATQPLPVPVRGGSLGTLRELLGLTEEGHWLLVRGWLVGALFSEFPRPLLWAVGTQGSAKTTRARMILGTVEPTPNLGKEPGKNERDDSTAARGRYLVSYDNITNVSTATSDFLCRLVTGVTDDRRALYTDDGLRPISYRRSGVATSRTLPSGLGSDALERLILLPLSRIGEEERRGERELSTAFHAAHPLTLGALLDLAALALANYPEAVAAKVKRPRMADYGNVLLALDRGLGLPEDAGHFAAYVSAVNTSQAERALDDPFTRAVLQIVAARGGKWVGTLDAALRELDRYRTRDVDKWWPTNPRALSSQLSKATVPLENAGVTWGVRKSDGTRRLTLLGPSEMPDSDDVETPTPDLTQ